MMGMHAWSVSWLTRQSMQTQHQRQRLFQNKRVFLVFVDWKQDFTDEPRIMLISSELIRGLEVEVSHGGMVDFLASGADDGTVEVVGDTHFGRQ